MRRSGFLGLLLCALLLRVGIPTGMMLVPTEGGLPRVVPCPSQMPAFAAPPPAPVAHRGHHGGHAEAQPHDHRKTPEPPPCPFGVLLFPALPSAPPMLAARAVEPEPLPPPPQFLAALPPAPAHLRPPATGPPLRA